MLAADKGDIGNIIAAHLIDIVRHLEQAVQRVVLRIAPQAGLADEGTSSASRTKSYASCDQIVMPFSALMIRLSGAAINPRRANSVSCSSEKSSC
ncbi:MAG: hypothetical protein V8Q82_03820 [Christensenellales bacterium]